MSALRYYQVFRNPETGEISKGALTGFRTKDGRDVCIVEASSWDEAFAKAQEIFRLRARIFGSVNARLRRASAIRATTRNTPKTDARHRRYHEILRDELAKKGYPRSKAGLSLLPKEERVAIQEAAKASLEKEIPKSPRGGQAIGGRQRILEAILEKFDTLSKKDFRVFLVNEIALEKAGNDLKKAGLAVLEKSTKKKAGVR